MYQDPQVLLDIEQISDTSAFAEFAASFWSDHLQAAQLRLSNPLYDDCVKMLTRPALLRSVIKLSYYKAKINLSENEAAGHYSDFKDEALRKKTIVVLDITADTVPPLHYNSLLGLAELVLKLLAAGEEINTAGPLGIFLAAATYCGHKKFVRVLLNKGAGVNAVVQQTHHRHEK